MPQPSTAAGRSLDAVALVCVCVAAAVCVDTLWTVVRFHSALPIWDEWYSVNSYKDWIETHYPLDVLTRQHNEHRIFFPRLVFFADFGWFGGRQIFTSVVILAAQAGHAALLLACLRRAGPRSPGRLVLGAAIVILLFSLRQVDNFVWKFELSFVLVFAAATLCFVAFGRAIESRRHGRPYRAAFVLALLSSAVATFSLANGLLCGFVLLLLAVVMRAPPWIMAILAVWTALLTATFFYGYQTVGDVKVPWDFATLVRVLRFLTAYLGNPSGTNLRLAQALGLWGLVATAAASWYAVRTGRTAVTAPILFAVIAFIVGTAMLTTLGRIQGGNVEAMTSRYTTPSAVFWAAQLAFWWGMAAKHPPLARRLWLCLGPTAAVLTAGALVAQLNARAGLETRALALQQSTDAMLADVIDPVPFDWLTVDPELTLQLDAFLREKRMSVFADDTAGLLHRPLAFAGSWHDDRACLGALTRVESAPDLGAGALRVSGRAWDLRHAGPVARVLLAGADGTVVGYASGYPGGGDKAEWRGYAVSASPADLRAVAWLGGKRLCALGIDAHPSLLAR